MCLCRCFQALVASCLVLWGASARAQSDCPPDAPALATLDASAPVQAADRGFLFAAQRAGRTSYVFGTVHLGNTQTAALGARTLQALQAADTLALELDFDDADVLHALQRGINTQEPRVQISTVQVQQVRELMAAACLSWLARRSLDSLHPNVRLAQLAVAQYKRLGWFSQLGSEAVLGAAARERGMRRVSLETPQLHARLYLGRDSAQAQAEFDGKLEGLASGSELPKALRLLRAWGQSDWPTLRDFANWCECADTPAGQAALRELLDDRNVAMAREIAKLHESGAAVFAAVGALHLSGPQSVQSELSKLGFEVTRVHPAPGQ
jgi:uncharacterized protein